MTFNSSAPPVFKTSPLRLLSQPSERESNYWPVAGTAVATCITEYPIVGAKRVPASEALIAARAQGEAMVRPRRSQSAVPHWEISPGPGMRQADGNWDLCPRK